MVFLNWSQHSFLAGTKRGRANNCVELQVYLVVQTHILQWEIRQQWEATAPSFDKSPGIGQISMLIECRPPPLRIATDLFFFFFSLWKTLQKLLEMSRETGGGEKAAGWRWEWSFGFALNWMKSLSRPAANWAIMMWVLHELLFLSRYRSSQSSWDGLSDVLMPLWSGSYCRCCDFSVYFLNEWVRTLLDESLWRGPTNPISEKPR